MRLSVILACYNGEKTLADQMDGLASQEWSKPWEVVFVDNGSTDNSRAIAERYKDRLPCLRIIDASEKQGKSFALNKGIRAARGELIAFADADDQVAPGWLAAMGNALETHDLVACRWDIDALNSERSRRYRRNAQLDGVQEVHYPPYLPHAGGGTIGIRRELHMKIGGFDESLRHLEDTDYVWKAQLAGARIHFEPAAVMRIRFRDDIKSIYMQNRNYAEYNVFLSRRYRSHGEPMPHPWRKFFSAWLSLARTSRRLFRGPGPRAVWTGKLGWQLGLLRGVLKYRVPPV
ncbi:MAG TPA: glycosyltransferase family 2 protein [Gammaproteobacteria bacterium]|nr:glycosyltransferase family 2 protein [Gammaproteobacteria bacterium]